MQKIRVRFRFNDQTIIIWSWIRAWMGGGLAPEDRIAGRDKDASKLGKGPLSPMTFVFTLFVSLDVSCCLAANTRHKVRPVLSSRSSPALPGSDTD